MLQKNVIIEGFCQEFDGAGAQRLHAHTGVAMRSDEDGRDATVFGIQSGLQVEAGHSGHSNVGDKASGFALPPGKQELFGGSEHLRWQPHRVHQALQGNAD